MTGADGQTLTMEQTRGADGEHRHAGTGAGPAARTEPVLLAALAAVGGVLAGYAVEHPGRYAATRVPLDASTAAASAGPRHAELSRAALRDYALDGADETHAVRLLGATFHGYAALDSAGAFGHRADAPTSDETWERVLDGLDTLLRSWETR